MKILILASYFYKEGKKAFEKNRTGYGLLIPEIAMAVGSSNSVFLQTYRNTAGFKMESHYGECYVVKKPLISSASISIKSIKKGIECLFLHKSTLRERLHEIYYWMNYGIALETIKKYKPDIVHVNNICEPFIEACIDSNISYLVTLHGLNGFIPKVSENIKSQERYFVEKAAKDNLIYTVISTGIRNRIISEYLPSGDNSNILVIPNGTDLSRGTQLKIDENSITEKRIITVIGTVCENKNQMQIVEAVALLGEKFDGWELHICGVDQLNGKIEDYVESHNLRGKVIMHGFVNPNDIDKLLCTAKLNILASKEEGFGISMIEAFAHGVPTVTFSDLDAVEDIYNPNAMLLCSTRKTEDLAETIYSAMNREWSQEEITNHAMKFSLQNMALKYISAYEKVLSKSGVRK